MAGKGESPNGYAVLAICAVAATVAGITIFAVQHYSSAADAGTILGIVIPVFATVGAAVFGVTAAYQAGSTTGGAQATQATKANIAGVLTPQLDAMFKSLQPMLDKLEEEGVTKQGSSAITIAPAHPVELDQAEIAAIRKNLAGIEGSVRALQ